MDRFCFMAGWTVDFAFSIKDTLKKYGVVIFRFDYFLI